MSAEFDSGVIWEATGEHEQANRYRRLSNLPTLGNKKKIRLRDLNLELPDDQFEGGGAQQSVILEVNEEEEASPPSPTKRAKMKKGQSKHDEEDADSEPAESSRFSELETSRVLKDDY